MHQSSKEKNSTFSHLNNINLVLFEKIRYVLIICCKKNVEYFYTCPLQITICTNFDTNYIKKSFQT